MSKKLSSFFSSVSSCSSNGPRTTMRIKNTNSNSSESCPSLMTTGEDCLSSEALANDAATRGGESGTDGNMTPQLSNYGSSQSPTDTLDHCADGKENQTTNALQISDAIADIAASCNVQSRRKMPSPQQSDPSHVPIMTRPPKILTASISNHYVPPTLKKRPLSRSKINNLADSSSNAEQEKSVHMFNAVGLKCGDDGKVLLEQFDDDDNASLYASGAAIPVKSVSNGGKDASTTTLPWTLEQHRAFAAAIFEIGLKDSSPTVIMDNMRKQSKQITRERTKSRLQKYRQTKERSRSEFLKDFDAFFDSTEEAKDFLQNRKSNALENKEPSPKAVLATALEGKKPKKLLGGKVAALLSYSALNGLNTSRGPDELEYKAAVLSEFPSLTEEEKRSSLGSSLMQVKTLIENMTDVLLKSRNGLRQLRAERSGISDDESDSSACSFDGEDSDEDGSIEGNIVLSNSQINAGSKGQKPMAVSSAPMNPSYQQFPAGYPAPFPAQGFPPSRYPPSFYSGVSHRRPPTGTQASFNRPIHYPHGPRTHPYQVPSTQPGPHTGALPMQPNYYPTAPAYPSYQRGGNEKRSRSPSIEMAGEHIIKDGTGDDFEEFLDRLSEVPSPKKSRKSHSTERRVQKRSRQSKEHHHHHQHHQARYFQPAVPEAYSKKYERSEDAQFLASDAQSLTASTVECTPIAKNHIRTDVDDQHQDGNNGGFWGPSPFERAGYNNQAPTQTPDGLSYNPDPTRLSPTERTTPSYYFGDL